MSIKIRGFHGNGMCHEIVLSNGTVILIDPFFTTTEEASYLETIERCDYVLVTHGHFDHDIDVGYLVQKFRPKVLVGMMTAMPFMKYHKIPFDDLIPVYPNEVYHFPEFTVETVHAKHNTSGGRVYDPNKKDTHMEGHEDVGTWGSVESIDFSITTNDNFRIMTASGERLWDAQRRIAEAFAPDLVIRQSGVRTGDMWTGVQVEPEVLADLFLSYGAPVVIPGHYDVLLKRWGDEKTQEYFAKVDAAAKEKRPGTTILYPETGKFYQIGVTVQ